MLQHSGQSSEVQCNPTRKPWGLGHSCPCRRVTFIEIPLYQSAFYFSHAELAIPSHSELLQWEMIGKVANWAKYAILSHSEPLWWEKIGKVVNKVKLAILSHYEPLQWENIGKIVNQVKLAIPSHYEPLQWEKIGKVANQAKSNFSLGEGRWGVHRLTQI